MKKERVLFITPSAYPIGGFATWIDYLIPGLTEKGWEVMVGLTSGRCHNVEAYLNLHPLEKVIKVENKTGSREGRIRGIIEVINKTQPDILAVVNIPDTYLAIERLGTKKNNFPKTVMTIHGIQSDIYGDLKNYQYVIDAVICTNKLACRLASEISEISPDNIYYAPCGVELAEKQRTINKNKNKLRIAYVGRLDPFHKRIKDIPEILLNLKKQGVTFEILIAGTGPEEILLKDRVHNLGISDSVLFLGSLSYSEVIQRVYQNVDILLVTSFSETGPIVIWEAMANGVAVVTSSYIGSGLEDSLKDRENCLLFPIGDTEKAAQCIEELCNIELRSKLIKAGYQLVKKRYSHENSIESWNKSFHSIINSIAKKTSIKHSKIKPAGRLDQLFGIKMAENVRSFLGRKFTHNDTGGEWPHSYGFGQENDDEFWKMAMTVDRPNG